MKAIYVSSVRSKAIRIEVEGDNADDVFDAFTVAMRDAGRAAKAGTPLNETHRYKSAMVKVNVEPGEL